ncbi:HIT-like protein [Gyrodon lividus]|nr:HIT-like protein [Gyrodon lividus]
MSGLFVWLVFQNPMLSGKSHPFNTTGSPESEAGDTEQCVFCRAYSDNRDAFSIIWEDADFMAFRDRSPASLHHFQLIPKIHIDSVQKLTKRDADMVRRMEKIGNDILDQYQVPPTHRRMGFHIPPFNSVHHLHLHVQALPHISLVRRLKYPVVGGFGTFDKGFSWFADVGQTIRILQRGSTSCGCASVRLRYRSTVLPVLLLTDFSDVL